MGNALGNNMRNEISNTLIHELGHTIGKLGDEYCGTQATIVGLSENSFPNITLNRNASNLKWSQFVHPVSAP